MRHFSDVRRMANDVCVGGIKGYIVSRHVQVQDHGRELFPRKPQKRIEIIAIAFYLARVRIVLLEVVFVVREIQGKIADAFQRSAIQENRSKPILKRSIRNLDFVSLVESLLRGDLALTEPYQGLLLGMLVQPEPMMRRGRLFEGFLS